MKASNYRRLPLEFEAIRWDSNPETAHAVEAWTKASSQATRYDIRTGVLLITTQEGGVGCKAGDYLVRGIEGEVYPVIERRFKALYESANPPSIGSRVRIKGTNSIRTLLRFTAAGHVVLAGKNVEDMEQVYLSHQIVGF